MLVITKNIDPGKCGYNSNCIGFDAKSHFSLPIAESVKNVIIGVNNSLLVHADNTKKIS